MTSVASSLALNIFNTLLIFAVLMCPLIRVIVLVVATADENFDLSLTEVLVSVNKNITRREMG